MPGQPGKELYSIGVAGGIAAARQRRPFVMLTQTADVKWWQELLRSLREEVAAKSRHVDDLEGWLKERDAELAAAQTEIAAMQATRVWRLGLHYWDLRDRLLRRSRRQS